MIRTRRGHAGCSSKFEMWESVGVSGSFSVAGRGAPTIVAVFDSKQKNRKFFAMAAATPTDSHTLPQKNVARVALFALTVLPVAASAGMEGAATAALHFKHSRGHGRSCRPAYCRIVTTGIPPPRVTSPHGAQAQADSLVLADVLRGADPPQPHGWIGSAARTAQLGAEAVAPAGIEVAAKELPPIPEPQPAIIATARRLVNNWH
jgi:hypothetical protein